MSETAQAEEADPDSVLTLREAMTFAIHLHRSGQRPVAEAIYRRILETVPDSSDALHHLGIARHQDGQSEEAVELIRRAIAITPGAAAMHNNLGNVLSECGRQAEAAEAYQAAIQTDPGHSDARSNLGVAYRALGRTDEAEAVYREAIALNPRHREAYDNLGRLLSGRGLVDEAIACHLRAIEIEPQNADSRRLLTIAYTAIGQHHDAGVILRDWLRDEPDNPTALHLMAAHSGENVPERASDSFVEATFDRFAASFDRKLAKLGYRAPELVGAAVAAACGEPASDRRILDAGCGTGLCGPHLSPYASRLDGVDLSEKMLVKARAVERYDTLEQAELTRYLLDHPASFDVVASADTLCYFGALDGVMSAAAAALRPGGILVFTVEEERAGTAVRLNPHGRYSHSPDHVRSAIEAAGLRLVAMADETLRMEVGVPVPGLVVTAHKP